MARIKLDGLSYFPFDVSFFDSRKIKALRSKFGNDGIVLYIYLLSEIYRDRGYYLEIDEDFYGIAADDNGVTEDVVKEIVSYFCRNHFFNARLFAKNVLTSGEIQKQYQECVRARGKHRQILVNKDIWLPEDEDTEDFICFEGKNCFGNNPTKKSKENKSKVNKSKGRGKTGDKTFDAEAFAKWEFENTYSDKGT